MAAAKHARMKGKSGTTFPRCVAIGYGFAVRRNDSDVSSRISRMW